MLITYLTHISKILSLQHVVSFLTWYNLPCVCVCVCVCVFCIFYISIKKSEVKVAQSCPTLCDSMDYTVHGILQARILEWIVFPFSRGSPKPRN